MINVVKKAFGLLLAVAGIILGAYVGLWWLFVKPIMGCVAAANAGCLTALRVALTIIKCYFGGSIGIAIFVIFAVAGSYFWKLGDKHGKQNR